MQCQARLPRSIFKIPLVLLLLLTAAAPSTALAQRGSDQPMWLAGAHLEGVSRETAGGYDFFVTGNLRVASSAGPVSSVLVQLVLTGPAGEQIHTEAVTGRDGVATVVTSVPGPGDYGATLYDMHGDGYYYDPRQNQLDIPTFILEPPDGIAALIENGQVDRVGWFKPGSLTSSAVEIASWNVSGSNFGRAEALATDTAGYVYVGSVYDGWGLCTVVKHTWYGVQVSSYQPLFLPCSIGDSYIAFKRIALATNLHNELLVARSNPDRTVTVDRFNTGGSPLENWTVDLPFPTAVPSTADFWGIGDIAADSQGRVYVAFVSGNVFTGTYHGIKVTSNVGTPLFTHVEPLSGLFGFYEGIDVDAAGNVFVAFRDEILVFDVSPAGEFTIDASWESASLEYYFMLAANSSGAVFAGDSELLEGYAFISATGSWLLAGGISQQTTPAYSNVVAIDVTP